MQDIEVLWLDDDISKDGAQILATLKHKISGIKLFTAKSCEESEKILNSRTTPPQWAIVDLIVPQGKWEVEEYLPNPGIEYIKYLKKKYKDDINIVAFSILVTKNIEEKVKAAGAMHAFIKSNIAFADVLAMIQNKHNVWSSRQTPSDGKMYSGRIEIKGGQD